jgi:hypothetical protein
MSMLDKWLNKYAQNSEVATFATMATNRRTTHSVNGLAVADRSRQSGDILDFRCFVAALSPASGDRKLRKNRVFARNVAIVANVAILSSDHRRPSLPQAMKTAVANPPDVGKPGGAPDDV